MSENKLQKCSNLQNVSKTILKCRFKSLLLIKNRKITVFRRSSYSKDPILIKNTNYERLIWQLYLVSAGIEDLTRIQNPFLRLSPWVPFLIIPGYKICFNFKLLFIFECGLKYSKVTTVKPTTSTKSHK